MSYTVQHRSRPRAWSPRQYAALGPGMRVIAFGESREEAKERAIAQGIATPLVMPAARIREVAGEY